MQKTNKTNNDENIDPDHFQNTTSTTRTQNFSFASTYQPSTGHFISTTKQADYKQQIPTSNLSNSLGNTAYNIAKPISSFSVLNSEDFYTANNSFVGNKPNAIVRPIRRSDQTALPGKNGQQQNTEQHEQETDTDSTYSQPYQYQLSDSTVTQSTLAPNNDGQNYANTFAEELNRKLSFLHSRDPQQSMSAWTTNGYHRHYSHDVGNQEKGKGTLDPLALSQRPLFITTVPTGVFLPPPKEVPLPAFLRPYVYSSHPVVLSGSSYNSNYDKSPTFSKDKLRSYTAPIAATDKDFMSKTTAAPNTMSSSSSRLNGSHAQTLTGGVHLTKEQFRQQIQQHRAKRELTKEPYKNVMFDRRVVRGSNFGMNRVQPNYEVAKYTTEEHQQQNSRYRPNYERFRRSIGSKIPQPTRRDEVIQTDDELPSDFKRRSAEFSVNTQTELIPYMNDLHVSPNKQCVDVSTEIEDGELSNQYEVIGSKSLLDTFVEACFEDAVTELAYEVELQDLREKCKALENQLSGESIDWKRLENADSTASEQDTTAAKLLHGHIAKLVPEVLENLGSTSNIEPNKKDEVMKSICPWLTVEVAEEVGQIVDSREILTVIIEEIIKQRAAVFGDSKDMPEIVANIEEIEEITAENNNNNNKAEQAECK